MHHKGSEHFAWSNIVLVGDARILGATMNVFITVVPCGELQLLEISCIHDFMVAGIPNSELILSQLIQFPNHPCDFIHISLICHYFILLNILESIYNSTPLLHKLYHVLHKKANYFLFIISKISSLLFLSIKL